MTIVPLDSHAQRFLDLIEAAGGAERSLAAYRAGYANLSAFARAAECEAADDRLAVGSGGIAIRVYSPAGAGSALLPGLVWFHGGGWIAGGIETGDRLCRSLCRSSGCRLIAVDYRLAPEHAFPAGLEDCRDAVVRIWTNRDRFALRADRFAIGGESAGAHLAIVASRMAVDLGVAFARQLLLCPVVDPFGDWPSRRLFAKGFLLEETALQDYLRFYGASLDPDDDRLSPLRGLSLRGFPPADVHTAEFDPVRDEGNGYAQALARSNVPIRYIPHPGMIHNFYGLTAVIPAARQALSSIGEAFGRALLEG